MTHITYEIHENSQHRWHLYSKAENGPSFLIGTFQSQHMALSAAWKLRAADANRAKNFPEDTQ